MNILKSNMCIVQQSTLPIRASSVSKKFLSNDK